MAYSVSNEYKRVIYSGDAKNKLKLLFNNVELEDADRYCEKLTIKSRIIPNGAKIFNLNNFISKEVELILHDIDTSIIQDQVSISIGTLVGNAYEYVPIGIFNIQDQPTNDKNKTTIKLRDNSVKFDFNYNAQPLIEANNGSATKLQILQDICTQAGVTCNITSFIGYLDEIGVYDNTIMAREYISRIAENAGKIATINRSGELIFVDLNNLTTWEIPIEIVEKYENGTKFKIGRVVYEDGIVRYETPTSNDDTLFLDGSNNYINGGLILEQANSNINSYTLQNTGETDLEYYETEGKTTQETSNGYQLLKKATRLNGTVRNSVTTNGITFTNLGSGHFHISGTATARTDCYTFRESSEQESIIVPIGKYTFSAPTLPNGVTLITSGGGGNNGFAYTELTSSLLSATSNVTDGTKPFNYFLIRVSSGTTVDTDIYFMLESGTVAHEWEPYEGIPSPEYPSELVSVGYQNLFDKNTENVLNAYINGSSVITSSSPDRSYWLPIKRNTNYTIKMTQIAISTSAYVDDFQAGLFTTTPAISVSGSRVFSKVRASATEDYTFTETFNSGNYDYLVIKVGNNTRTKIQESLETLQLQEGIQAHSYIPYGKYGIEVKTTGKNLFDGNIELGSLSNGSPVGANTRLRSINFSKVSPNNTYTVSWENDNANINSGVLVAYYSNNNYISATSGYTTTRKTFTTPNNCNYVKFLWANANNGSTVLATTDISNIQLEKGNTATTYEAYKENTYLYTLDEPLRGIGSYKDKLYIRNGYLYVERQIGKLLLKGNETGWAKSGASATEVFVGAFPLSTNNIYSKQGTGTYWLVNRFSQGTLGALNRFNAYNPDTTWGYRNLAFGISSNIASTINDFKTWVSNNNIEVQYILKESHIEELGQIEIPSTYQGITYIDIASNINTNTYLQYRKNETQVEAILDEVDEFNIDSLKTGKILGNPAIDPYDLIQIHDTSRNIFDKNNINLINAYYVDGTGKIVYGNNNRLCWLKLQPNTTYTLTQTIVSNVNRRVALFDNEPTTNLQGTLLNTFSGANPIKQTFTTTNTSIYVAWVYCNLANLNGYTEQKMLDSIQLEKGNVATDYVPFKDETYTTLATNELTYTGVLINTFDTQIGEEAKEQNVFVNGEDTFQKWARTTIDNVEASITLQAGEINTANGRINETNLRIDKDGALLNVIANNSNIDIAYDGDTPISGQVREVTTTTGFTFNAEGMTIEDTSSNFKAQHRNTGTYYKDGDTIVGQYTKDGSKQKDLELFGVYYYGKNDLPDDAMFVAQLYTDENGDEGFGHFYNRGD